MTRYLVSYYDAKLSHKGQGVQVARFKTLELAEMFAEKNKLYSKPCRVEEVEVPDEGGAR